MWVEGFDMLDRADRLHRQFFHPGRARARRPTWEPPVDMFETEDDLWILVALPGVAPERVEVAVDTGALIVAGERPMPVECRAATIHRLEIPHGRFERRISLPTGRFELGRRELVNGCLAIGLRKLG
jgi:HSP20 family molecular chaperone IbpA